MQKEWTTIFKETAIAGSQPARWVFLPELDCMDVVLIGYNFALFQRGRMREDFDFYYLDEPGPAVANYLFFSQNN